MFYGTIKPSNE